MWKIKDRDAYLEARKRLAGSKAAALPPKSDPALTDPKVAAPKRQPKGGKEGKGTKNGKQAAGAAEETQG